MELNKLGIFHGQAGSGDGTASVPGAGVGAGATLVGSSGATGGQDGVVGPDSVDGPVGDAHHHDAPTGALGVHDQVKEEILYKEYTIISQGSAEEGVEHAVAGSVGHTGSAVGLAPFPV